MQSFLDNIRRLTDEKKTAEKAKAEAAEAQASVVADAATRSGQLRDRVRDALQLSTEKFSGLATQHKEELASMVAKNKEGVASGLDQVKGALDEAAAAGVEVSVEDAQGARIEAIKGGTVEGLKAKRDEGRVAAERSHISSQLRELSDDITDEEAAVVEAANESGDVSVLKSVIQSVSERVTAKKVEAERVALIDSRVEELEASVVSPDDATKKQYLDEFLHACKTNPAAQIQLKEYFTAHDLLNENGKISYEEFVKLAPKLEPILRSKMQYASTEDQKFRLTHQGLKRAINDSARIDLDNSIDKFDTPRGVAFNLKKLNNDLELYKKLFFVRLEGLKGGKPFLNEDGDYGPASFADQKSSIASRIEAIKQRAQKLKDNKAYANNVDALDSVMVQAQQAIEEVRAARI